VVIWGVNFAAVKYALASFSPLALNSVRFVVAAAVVIAAALLSGRRWRFERRHLPALIALGVLGNTGYQLLFIYGAAATTADNTGLILATVPAWVALFGTAFGVERVRPLGWVGVALSLSGIAVIVAASDRAADFHFGGATLHGDLLVLACTLCWSLYTLASRPLTRRYGALTVTSFCVAVGAVPLILAGLPDLLARAAVPTGAWAAATASGALAIGAAYFCWNHGISQLGSARTSLYSNLTPPVALVTAWLALGETLTAGQAAGAALAIAGVVLARRHASPVDA
jgi:drug/metabolite transporter (DMT)-like permease